MIIGDGVSSEAMSASQPKSIVVLTGAGISSESGIKTFRDNDGLWENHRIEDVATPEAFAANPEFVHRFYNARRGQLISEVEPNAGHLALAQFEQTFDGRFMLVTQNVDDLHERAGSQNLFHMHGELLKARCMRSGDIHAWIDDLNETILCTCCQSPGNLRPHIVWFGEMPFYMDEIEQALADCDMFISIGTSGNVYPAAGFVQVANGRGAHTVELNLEPTITESHFREQHYGPASSCVPKFLSAHKGQ
ncbi:MAG: NAD-dependent deacetylase [Planctomycetota bacterium]|jgi:NAD-dependent deacetylase